MTPGQTVCAFFLGVLILTHVSRLLRGDAQVRRELRAALEEISRKDRQLARALRASNPSLHEIRTRDRIRDLYIEDLQLKLQEAWRQIEDMQVKRLAPLPPEVPAQPVAENGSEVRP